MLVDRNLEIFELEEKIKELEKYQGMYYKKVKELNKIRHIILHNFSKYPDELKIILEEIDGINYN